MLSIAHTRIRSLIFAILAGLAFWAAFPGLAIWPLALVGVGLLWNALTSTSARGNWAGDNSAGSYSAGGTTAGLDRPSAGWNALVGFLAGLAFFGPHVWWATVATAVVPWVALTLLQAAFWAVLGLFWAWTLRFRWIAVSPWRQALAFAVLFTGIEQWRSSIPFSGFPWGRLAWAVAGATPGRAAWLGGSVLVTFLLAYTASLVAITARAAFRARRRPGQYLPPTYAPPKAASAKTPSRFQKLLRPELELLPDQVPAAPVATSSGDRSQSAIKRRAMGILVPAHLQPTTSSELGDSPELAKTPVSPDLRLVIGAFAALLLLAVPSWFPLPHDAEAVPFETIDSVTGLPLPPRDRVEWVDAGINTAQAGVLQMGIAQGNVAVPDDSNVLFQGHLQATNLLIADAARRAAEPGEDWPSGVGAGYDIIVWPESSAPWDPARWPEVAAILDDYATRAQAPILIGTMEYPDSGGRYNVMLLWEAGEGAIARYAKQIPVPYGEYIPLRNFARFFTDQVDRLPIDMLAADNPPVVTWHVPRLGQEVTIGLGICYEVAYDHIFIDAVRQGAEVIVIPTSNAMFGLTPQSVQQLQMTQMQAITTGRASVQISTVGVSGVFTPDGQLVARAEHWEQDRISALLPLRTSLTPAVRLGMGPAYLFQALSLILPLAGLFALIGERQRGRNQLTPDQAGALSAMAIG